eukprot:5522977-Prorocentrum_lima.AAC.1
MTKAIKPNGIVVTAQGDHKDEPMEVYQDGLLAHVVGLLRSQLSVPHEDTEGEQGGEPRRAMGGNCNSVLG